MDGQSGTSVGYVFMGVLTDKDGNPTIKSFTMSKNGIDFIYGETADGPSNYWGSLGSCGNSGPFLASGLNVLQQLPGAASSTIKHQPRHQ